jgi:hypothetical protein
MTDTNPRDLIKRLADSLHEAADDVEGWGNYASSYFQEKHDLSGNVARIHAQADEARAYLDHYTAPKLSPTAQAVVTAVIQSEYCLDPSDIPNEAARMASIAAAADTLEAAADQMTAEPGALNSLGVNYARDALYAIAAELRGITIATWNHAQEN